MFTSSDDIRSATSAKKGAREGSITRKLQQRVSYFSKVSTSNCVFSLFDWEIVEIKNNYRHFVNFTSWMLSQLSQPLWSIVLLAPWALYLPSLSGHGRSMQPRFILRWSGHWPNWRNRWWQSMKNLWQKKLSLAVVSFWERWRDSTHICYIWTKKSWEHLHPSHFMHSS